MKAALPSNEVQRLATLRGYEILDTLPEQAFDDLTMLAAQICQTPIALISLVDEKRQWFKSEVGLGVAETSRDLAFCAHAILNPLGVLEVGDALLDPRFADNLLVTGEPHIRFYAGAPLAAADGTALGTLCVIDRVPRELSEEQKQSLQALGRHVVSLLELRRSLVEQHLTEKALRESESRFHDLFENAHDLILSVGPDGTIIYANRALRETLGYSETEMTDLTLQDIVNPSSFSHYMDIFHQALPGEASEQVETLFQTRDGRTIISTGNSTCHFVEGKPVATRSILRDITGLKRAERQRGLMFNCALDLYAIANFKGYFIQANPAWEKTLGWSTAEVLARPYLEFIHPDDREATTNAAASLVDGRTIDNFDNRFQCKDGSYKWFSWVAYSQAEEGLIFAIARDVTESKRVEQLLRTKNEELKTFAYTVSHDLKAPLRGIAGYAQELVRRHQEGLSQRAQFCIAQITTASKNLDNLIEDLLKYSRLDSETPSLTDVNLQDLVRSILHDHKQIITGPKVVVEVKIPQLTLRIWERGLHQVMANLIDNAIKYSRQSQPPRLTIKAEVVDGRCRVSVSDNGVGFDMKYHDRIFGLFNRLVRADEFEGTGIGLSIVKKLIEKLGGSIRAESAPGEGATFFVELPVMCEVKP